MGNFISTDKNLSQILVRDKNGMLKLYPYTMEESLKCNPLPVALEDNVQFLFMPNTNYKGKNLHTHVFYDDECDIAGNDIIDPETVQQGMNLNHLKKNGDSNSSYFQLNEYPINLPPFPKFYDGPVNSNAKSQFARQTSYKYCRKLPYPPERGKTVSYQHNGIPLKFFTNEDCTNEYITDLPVPTDPAQLQKFMADSSPFNIDNRATDATRNNQPYTNVKTYLEPAPSTSASYYRIYETYPENENPSPQYIRGVSTYP
jgi:hypothetical protein